MIGECRATAGDLPVQSAPGTDWWTTAAALWQFDPAGVAGWQGIVSRIDKPAGFVCVPGTAAGMAICDGSWLGLFEIIVAPESRRQGLGRGVTESLLSWGSGQGAGRAYLQVVAENEDAIRFYQSLGFSRAYGYWYRRDQAANKPA